MTLTIVQNPSFAGKTPTLLQPACHDRTPFLTFKCHCGSDGHMHESQIAGAPEDALLEVRCSSCRGVNELLVEDARKAFADMRAEGWYA